MLTLFSPQPAVGDGEIRNITCLTSDCRPPANITWYKENSELTNQITSTKQNGSNLMLKTVSLQQYTGVTGDNGQQVYCRASNFEGKHVEPNKLM